MASSRKKQDEKNLKTLRELGMIPENKYCFDCGQRGPTYVNVTIGSFVCTKCSGMLRGLTPPHRVKSISMATFTAEEVELLRSRGNEYCRRVWLGLYGSGGADTAPVLNSNDEHTIRDFMIEKYERRRYYLEPSKAISPSATTDSKSASPSPPNPLIEDPSAPPHKPIQHRPAFRRHTPWVRSDPNKKTVNNNNLNNGHLENGFVADFSKTDLFGGIAENNQRVNGFVADFDNNPVFNGTNNTPGGVSAASSNSSINSTPLSSVGSTPISSIGSAPMSVSSTPIVPIANPIASSAATGSPWTATLQNGFAPPAPAIEDKYAALKDLDNEIRSQKGGVFEWSVGTTNAGAAFGTESQCQQGTALFGTSPVQVGGQPFAATFPEATAAPTTANPFGGAPWPPNPFKMNGVTAQAPSLFPQMVNGFGAPAPSVGGVGGGAWPPPANPFKVGCVRANSNNPFL